MSDKRYTDDELLDWIDKLADGDNPPKQMTMENSDGPSRDTYKYRFGSWANAVQQAGYDPRRPGGSEKQYTDDELLGWIDKLADGDNPPTSNEMDASDGPTSTVYYERFGSWIDAVREAGYDPQEAGDGKEYTDGDLIEWIHAFVEFYGVVPSHNDLYGWPGPSQKVYEQRIGSVAQAVREAGYTPRGDRSE